MDLGLLIMLVQAQPHLYDKSSKNYKNRIVKENSWLEIANAMNKSEDDCQKAFKNLRDRYVRTKKGMPSGSGASDDEPFDYFYAMSFLEAHIRSRKTHTATPQVPDTERTSSSCSSSRPWSSMTEILTPEPGSEGSEEESQIVIEVTETDTSQNATSQDESRQEDYVLQTPTRHPAKRQFSESTPRNKGKKEGPVNEIMGVAKDIVKSLHARTQTSEDAFGSYVALRLKEMDRVTSSKRKQEIIAILDASASNSE